MDAILGHMRARMESRNKAATLGDVMKPDAAASPTSSARYTLLLAV